MDRSEQCSEIKKITWIAAISNILLFAIKFFLGLVGASQALVADAFHSLSDMSTDFIIIFGVRYWTKPADENHPYGHKRIETIISAAIGVIVLLIGIVIAYNAVLTIINRTTILQPKKIAFFAAFASIVIKEMIYRKTLSRAKELGSSALRANAWHHRTDVYSSIPVAIAIALSIINPAWSIIDRIGALVVSFFIISASFKIIKPALSELCDSGVLAKTKEDIYSIANNVANVKNVHAIRYRKMASEIFVDMHIMVDSEITVYEGHEIAKRVKAEIIKNVKDIVDVTVHIEPYTKK